MGLAGRFSKFGITLEPVKLVFTGEPYDNIFEGKNNKTLQETLCHKRYAKLSDETFSRYPDMLEEPLGTFLGDLKRRRDQYYKRFLNKYGDDTYSIFEIDDSVYLDCRGVYAFFSGDDLAYTGRCRDSMRKRINQGYGRIQPKNCYLDGQATNCHLNSRITASRSHVSLWLHPMSSVSEIEDLEKVLICEYPPTWNIQKP